MYEVGRYVSVRNRYVPQRHQDAVSFQMSNLPLAFQGYSIGSFKQESVCLRVSSLKPNNKNNNIVSFERIWEEPNEEPTLGPTSRHDLGQCDQMASLFFNICSFKGMEISPMA